MLGSILDRLPKFTDPNLIIGTENFSDSGVYRVAPDMALVMTIDFFPPVLDDPYLYGQAAAANSISDVYVMGAKPVAALNMLCCPKTVDREVLAEIMRGGAEKVHESGAIIVGGHSVESEQISYGFAVVGTVHPDRVITNAGAKPGDRLLLTKPLGIGLLTTAVKKGIAHAALSRRVGEVMARLNRAPSEAMVRAGASACTDVTGFGLVGHGRNVAGGSGVTLEFSVKRLPTFPEWEEYHGKGCMSGGSKRNRESAAEYLEVGKGVSEAQADLCCDAQTSGGLLIAVAPKKAPKLLEEIRKSGSPEAAEVGVVRERAGVVLVRLVP
ncbi:MAG: selenide, water dikinase SelD [Planctomycetales bacterium]|nr:selenide, water dikinase SelD [Planctomycetales bacterium]